MALVAGSFAVAVSAYFFLPADAKQTAKQFFTNVAAIVAQSWSDTFGGSRGEDALEIDLTASSSPADAAVAGDATSAVAIYGAPADIPVEKSKNSAAVAPVVILQVDTTTAVAAATATTTTGVAYDGLSQESAGSAISDAASGTANAAAAPPAVSSPPAQCALSTSAPLSRELIFNEIAWMGSPPLAGESGGTASNREWMELKNISRSALDLVKLAGAGRGGEHKDYF